MNNDLRNLFLRCIANTGRAQSPSATSRDLRTWDSFLNPIHSHPGVSLNFPLNRFAQFKPGLGPIVHLLELEPELGAVAEEL